MQQERRRAERAEVEAQTDALTELYNRRGWDQLLQLEEQRCRQFGHAASVLVLDLDDLKKINDKVGHAAGDEHLKLFASTMRNVLRKQDVAARIGGDEFAILGIEMDAQGVQVLVERLKVAFATTHVDASLGVAVRKLNESLSATWQRADLAMYQQKQRCKMMKQTGESAIAFPKSEL